MVQTKCGFNDAPGVPGSGLTALMFRGPTLKVNIGFDPNFNPNLTIVPVSGIQAVDALVDTGATESCIDNLLAVQLNLPIVNRRAIAGIHGSHIANMYLAQIHVLVLDKTIYGPFAGVDLKAGGQVHHALIGRTFLRHFTMIYEGRNGTVTLSND